MSRARWIAACAVIGTWACPATAHAAIVFQDTFDGAAGAPPNPAQWSQFPNVCWSPLDFSCASADNAYLDGGGNLVLRVRREGGEYLGAWVQTFTHDRWPPALLTGTAWAVPYRIEARALFANVDGLWPALWTMAVDGAATAHEIDFAEARMTPPLDTKYEAHLHTWQGPTDVKPATPVSKKVSSMRTNWHVYAADVRADGTDFLVDGKKMGSGYATTGTHGLLMDVGIGRPGSWGSGGGQPSASDPGPWTSLVDYVKVER